MLQRLANLISNEHMDDNLLDDGIIALFGEDFEHAVQYKSTFDNSRLEQIEQSALELANDARQIRLSILDRELDKIREGLLLDLMQEYKQKSLQDGKPGYVYIKKV